MPLCHTAVVTDVTCLFGCGVELPAAICIRPAAVPASVLRPALTYSWIRRRTGSGVHVRKRVALLKWCWKHDAAPASSSQTAAVSRWGRRFGKVESQVAAMGPRTPLLILEGDPRHPAVGQQMGYATVTVTLPVLSQQSVSLCVQCVVMQLQTICDIMLSIS